MKEQRDVLSLSLLVSDKKASKILATKKIQPLLQSFMNGL